MSGHGSVESTNGGQGGDPQVKVTQLGKNSNYKVGQIYTADPFSGLNVGDSVTIADQLNSDGNVVIQSDQGSN